MRRQASRDTSARPLHFEGLEPRRVLATFTVTNLLDDGPGSLRDAIDQANAAEGADEIDFAVTGVIPLESQLPTITDSVSINGPGRDLLTLDAGGGASPDVLGDGYRHFEVDIEPDSVTDPVVEIRSVTLTGGDVPMFGGAILREGVGELSIIDSALVGNHSSVAGGAIFNRSGPTHIVDTLIDANTAGIGGGGVVNDSGGVMHVTASVISNNRTLPEFPVGNGAGMYSRGRLSIVGSVVQGNEAYRNGGGLYVEHGSAHVTESEFLHNHAGVGAGDRLALGGAIAHIGDDLSVHASSFIGNTTNGYGGGVSTSQFARLTITASSFESNAALGSGGGIASGGPMQIHDSTISGNVAGDRGGGMFVYASNAAVSAASVTVIQNQALQGEGGGILVTGRDEFSVVSLVGSIVSGNDAQGANDLYGELDIEGFNFIGGDAMLGPLADNGGPTLTHAPLPGSPLVDAGDPAFDVNGPDGLPGTDDDVPFDQRGEGFARVAGGRVDIGAVEVQVAAPLLGDANDDGVVNLLDLDILGRYFGSLSFPPGADLNGDFVLNLLDLDVLSQVWGTTTSTFARGEAPLPGDANDDGVVDLLDLDILSRSTSFDLNADFNGDGRVNLLDLDILGQNWGRRALLLLGDDEPTESEDAPTIAARDEALADEPDTEQSPSLSGRG